MTMNNAWDSYWEKKTNQGYWLEPDRSVVKLTEKLDRTRITDILDLGCGIGRHTIYLAESGFKVTALDSSPTALAILQQKLTEKGEHARLIDSDYTQDLFREGSFDLVLSYNVIYHGYRKSMKETICSVHRWLRPQGLFFFTCPTRQDDKYGNGEEVAPHTFRSLNSVHPGDIHYFADESDILEFTHDYTEISRTLNEHYWDNNGTRQLSSQWQILAIK
jgi:tellurite methyltransferase